MDSNWSDVEKSLDEAVKRVPEHAREEAKKHGTPNSVMLRLAEKQFEWSKDVLQIVCHLPWKPHCLAV